MTDMEFEKTVLPMLVAAYPRYCAGLNAERQAAVFTMWVSAFWDTDVHLVEAALMSFACTDTKGYPPTVGQIWARVFTLANRNEPTEAEAWARVVRAMERCGSDGAEAFAGLPPRIQKLVGDAKTLWRWSVMDAGTVHSVIGSNFQRSYREAAARERAYAVLPPNMRETVDRLLAAESETPMLEGDVGNV